MNKKKVVITGGSGLFGSTAALKLSDTWLLDLWVRGHSTNLPNVSSHKVSLTSSEEIGKVLDLEKPDVVIHAAAATNVDECETQQEMAYTSNVLTTQTLARECAQRKIKFVYISTDQVSPDAPLSTEEDATDPVNVYAKTKLEGEKEALKFNPSALVIRTNFFAWGSSYRKSFLDFIVDNLRQKKQITLFDDVIYSPIAGEVLLKSIAALIDKDASGVFNVVCDPADMLSKYDFGIKVADIFQLDKAYITRGKSSDKKNLVKRPLDLSLNNQKLRTVCGVSRLTSLEESLLKLKSDEVLDKETLNKYFI